jgi:hypothetical protein
MKAGKSRNTSIKLAKFRGPSLVTTSRLIGNANTTSANPSSREILEPRQWKSGFDWGEKGSLARSGRRDERLELDMLVGELGSGAPTLDNRSERLQFESDI